MTDANGRALYLLEGSAGEDACLAVWPPLASPSAPEAGDTGLQARLMGTTKRPEGIPQATYRGHALYYYIGDRAARDTRGQHVEDSWGEWYLMSPREARLGTAGTGDGADAGMMMMMSVIAEITPAKESSVEPGI